MNTHRIHICKNNNKISHFSPLVMGSQKITLLIETIPPPTAHNFANHPSPIANGRPKNNQ